MGLYLRRPAPCHRRGLRTRVLPEVSTVPMAIFLEGFAGALPAHVHAVMALDQAGWHGSEKLTVPNNVSLAPLPPYSPDSVPPSVSGCFCASASFPFGSSTTRKPSSMAAATPGMPSPPKPAASNHYPATHGSQKSVPRLGGIRPQFANRTLSRIDPARHMGGSLQSRRASPRCRSSNLSGERRVPASPHADNPRGSRRLCRSLRVVGGR